MDILDKLRRCARPVIFEIDNTETPCSICGSSFVVGFGQSIFIITPKHVIKGYPVDRIRIYPSSNYLYKFRFIKWWFVETTPDEPDASDILIIKVDLNDIPIEDRSEAHVINLNGAENSAWYNERHESQFFLCGFPSTENKINYSLSQIDISQYFLEGVYVGESPAMCCHQIRVSNPWNLSHFGGLSGSPVFSCKRDYQVGSKPRFCGMALRGTASSCNIHFLDVDIFKTALDKIENNT